jgi:hypothetical protein
VEYLDAEDDAVGVEVGLDVLVDLAVEVQLEEVGGNGQGVLRQGVDHFGNGFVDHHFCILNGKSIIMEKKNVINATSISNTK